MLNDEYVRDRLVIRGDMLTACSILALIFLSDNVTNAYDSVRLALELGTQLVTQK